MSGRAQGWLSFFCAMALSACTTSSPDVVALGSSKIDTTDAHYFDVDGALVQGCSPGHYSGDFVSDTRDGGGGLLQSLFSGKISFSLIGSGEALTIEDNGTVIGTSNDGATFTADVLGEAQCEFGDFNTHLVNGKFTFPNVGTYPFYGPIKGHYFLDAHAFGGTWSAYAGYPPEAGVDAAVPQLLAAAGSWVALRVSDP